MNAPAMPPPVRREHDLLGEREVPADAEYGVQRPRKRRTSDLDPTELIRARAYVKQVAVRADHALGMRSAEAAQAIVAACKQIRAGVLHDQLVVDINAIQAGAGRRCTSTRTRRPATAR